LHPRQKSVYDISTASLDILLSPQSMYVRIIFFAVVAYVGTGRPGVNVKIIAKKEIFLKKHCYVYFFCTNSCILSQNATFTPFFGVDIFEVKTLIPDWANFRH
jgi:hypothetical protein